MAPPSQPSSTERRRRRQSLLDQQVDSTLDLYTTRTCVKNNVEFLKEIVEDFQGDKSATCRVAKKKLRLSIESLEQAIIPKVTEATTKLAPIAYLGAAAARLEKDKKKTDRKLRDISNAQDELHVHGGREQPSNTKQVS
jgi:hypothetical protein